MNPTTRNYRATFILDNSGKEDTVDQIVDGVKNDIAAVSGEVSSVENLGLRPFARITDPKLPAGHYVQITFSAPAQGPSQLKDRLRLNHSVYRTFVETL